MITTDILPNMMEQKEEAQQLGSIPPGGRYYLAGPMTNLPAHNFPAFDAAAVYLRKLGYDIISPAELDSPESRKMAMASPDGSPRELGETWGDFLARDIRLVVNQADGVIVLPGWGKSRGARLETFAAHLCGQPVFYMSGRRVPFARLQRAWLEGR